MKVCFSGGSGHSGSVIAALSRLPQVELSGFCKSYDAEKMNAIRHLNLPEYPSLEIMLDTVHPDILVSDGMFCRHTPDAIAALERGIPVFCEKPVSISEEQYNALTNVLHAPNAPLFWAMQTSRYMDCFYTARCLVQEGAIGQIRMMNSQKSYQLGTRPAFFSHRDQYGGTIPWVSIHAIDWMLWICGKRCRRVFSSQSSLENRGNGSLEMTAITLMELEGDILAHVNTDYYRPQGAPSHGDDRLRIVGTTGILEVREDQVYLMNDQEDGRSPLPLRHFPRLLFEDFMHALNGGTDCLITPEDSLYSTYVALKAQEAADLGHPILL